MKIGLLDIDRCDFPNLALMKIASYHKSLGDSVEHVHFDLFNPNHYDVVYQSKVFTFTYERNHNVNADKIIKGGTGYDAKIVLPEYIDRMLPDYSIYPKYESAYGFLTRGCPRKCSWCIVPKKEGNIRPESDIEEILQGRDTAILMDNNVLASDYGLDQIEKIARLGVRIDFNQGLDARLITSDIAELLSKVRWIEFIRMSCDTIGNLKYVIEAIDYLNRTGVKNYRIFVYVLLQDLNESYEIITKLKEAGCNPFAQPFRSFTSHQVVPQWQKDMAGWVNKKSHFKSCDFKDYRPRNGFRCDQYFNT